MHNAPPPDDMYKNYQYEYNRCKREVPYTTTHYNKPNVKGHIQSRVLKQGQGTEVVYNYPTVSDSSNKSNVEEELSNYEQPTLPYYVVPVLYVPKRVLPNEEMPSNYKTQVRPNSATKSKYYPKSHENTQADYEQFRNFYSQYYEKNGLIHYDRNSEVPQVEPEVEEDASYYNMQYSGSSSSFKDEPQYSPYQEAACSYTYVPKTKVTANNIRPLKSQPACQNYDYDSKKIRAKSRSAYECSQRKPQFDEYYYDHYNSPEPRKQYDFYSNYDYAQEYYERKRKSNLDENSRKCPMKQEMQHQPTRISNCLGNDFGKSENLNRNLDSLNRNQENLNRNEEIRNHENLYRNEDEKSCRMQSEKCTQTVEVKPHTNTSCTQTDDLEKKMFGCISKSKELEGVEDEAESGEDKEGVDGYKIQPPKELRRPMTTTRKKSPGIPVMETRSRLESPVRRLRKF